MPLSQGTTQRYSIGGKTLAAYTPYGQPSGANAAKCLLDDNVQIEGSPPVSVVEVFKDEMKGTVKAEQEVLREDDVCEWKADWEADEPVTNPRPTTGIKRLPPDYSSSQVPSPPVQASGVLPAESNSSVPESHAMPASSFQWRPYADWSPSPLHMSNGGMELPMPQSRFTQQDQGNDSHVSSAFQRVPCSSIDPWNYISPYAAAGVAQADLVQPPRKKQFKHKPMKKTEQLSAMADLETRLTAFNKAADEQAMQKAILATGNPEPGVFQLLQADGTYAQPVVPDLVNPVFDNDSCQDHASEPIHKRKRSQSPPPSAITPASTNTTPARRGRPPKGREKQSAAKAKAEKPKKVKPVGTKAKRNKLLNIPEEVEDISHALNELGAPLERVLDNIALQSEKIMTKSPGTAEVVEKLRDMTKEWKASNRKCLKGATEFLMRNGALAMGAVTVPNGSLDVVPAVSIADAAAGDEGATNAVAVPPVSSEDGTK
ncbi:hypothetical protein Slin14017_G000130 [Septoria linicola]|nr:hypothetical protein Slin14017_G000130 [Septoria linicola]